MWVGRQFKMADVLRSCSCWLRLKYGPDELEQLNQSKRIDKMLEKDKHVIRRQVKLLLLGAGESGKSTFLKQMKIIHGYNFADETLLEFRTVVHLNIIRGMKVLVDAREKLGIAWEDSSNTQYADVVLKSENSVCLDAKHFCEIVPAIKQLWKDSSVRTAFERRSEFQLGDGVRYFFENLNRIAVQDYLPSNQDILHARKATKGITEFTVPINGIPFRFVDVGGQRSQRQKWFQCFDSVTSILFLVSTSEFDQVLLEDRYTNRLLESRNIFETIVNNRCFSEVSVILFLNKTDLLKEKVERSETDITAFFKDFSGNPHQLEDVQIYILNMFDSVRRDQKKSLFHHFTTAVDTENIKVVFNAVRDAILQKNITALMLQ